MRDTRTTLRWILLLLATGLAGCESDREPVEPASFIPGWQTFYNKAENFEIRYPRSLSLEVNQGQDFGQTSFSLSLSYPNIGEPILRLATYDPDMRGHIELYKVADTETPTQVGGETATRFRVQNQEDGKPDFFHTLVVRSEKLYVFTGAGDTFDKLIKTMKFLDATQSPPDAPSPTLSEAP